MFAFKPLHPLTSSLCINTPGTLIRLVTNDPMHSQLIYCCRRGPKSGQQCVNGPSLYPRGTF